MNKVNKKFLNESKGYAKDAMVFVILFSICSIVSYILWGSGWNVWIPLILLVMSVYSWWRWSRMVIKWGKETISEKEDDVLN